jgi:hypothetical protein
MLASQKILVNASNVCSDSLAALWDHKAPTERSKLVWECQQAMCALSGWNKVILLWVPGHCGIEGNE